MIRNSRPRSIAFSVMIVISLVALVGREVNAFESLYLMSTPGQRKIDGKRIGINNQGRSFRTNHYSLLFGSPSDKDSDSVQKLFDYDGSNFDNEIDTDDLEEIEMGQPPEWMVMQQVSGHSSIYWIP